MSGEIVWDRHLVVVVGLLLRDRQVVLPQLEHFHVWVVPNLPEEGFHVMREGASIDEEIRGFNRCEEGSRMTR